MPNFHHHPDGLIFVRGEVETYCDTLENFEADYGQSLPALPEGMTERFYEPGVRHFFYNGYNAVPVNELSWEWGDAVIASLSALMAAQSARSAAPSN